jgi:hypothetical protein
MAHRRRNRRQLELALERTITPPVASESDKLYTAVMYLRSAGKIVYRAGERLHFVGSRTVSSIELMRMGRTAGSLIYR